MSELHREAHQATTDLKLASLYGISKWLGDIGPVKGADIVPKHRLVWGDGDNGDVYQVSLRWGTRTTPLGEVVQAALVCQPGQVKRLRVLNGHVETVRALAVDDEERQISLITAHSQKTWCNDAGRCMTDTPVPDAHGPVVFGDAGEVIGARGKELVRYRQGLVNVMGEHRSAVRALALHLDGTAAYSADDQHLRGWDLKTDKAMGVPMETPAPVTQMACGPSGLLTLDATGDLRLYPIDRYRLQNPKRSVAAKGAGGLTLGPAGEWVYALPDGTVKITPAPGQRSHHRQITGLTGTVHALHLVQGSKGWRLYAAGSAGIHVVDWMTGAMLGQFCPLQDGGYLWSAGEWLAGNPKAQAPHALVDVYRVDGQGCEVDGDFDHEQRAQYLKNHDNWQKLRSLLYPWLGPQMNDKPLVRPIPSPFNPLLLLGFGG